MEYFAVIEKMLKESVWGIIILGACGSIIGGFAIFTVKKVIKYLYSTKEYLFMRFTFIYGSKIKAAVQFVEQVSPSKDAQFIAYCITVSASLILVGFALISVILFGLMIILFFGFERYFSLSAILSVVLILFHRFTKEVFELISFHGTEIVDLHKECESKLPKTYKEWQESLHKN